MCTWILKAAVQAEVSSSLTSAEITSAVVYEMWVLIIGPLIDTEAMQTSILASPRKVMTSYHGLSYIDRPGFNCVMINGAAIWLHELGI